MSNTFKGKNLFLIIGLVSLTLIFLSLVANYYYVRNKNTEIRRKNEEIKAKIMADIDSKAEEVKKN